MSWWHILVLCLLIAGVFMLGVVFAGVVFDWGPLSICPE